MSGNGMGTGRHARASRRFAWLVALALGVPASLVALFALGAARLPAGVMGTRAHPESLTRVSEMLRAKLPASAVLLASQHQETPGESALFVKLRIDRGDVDGFLAGFPAERVSRTDRLGIADTGPRLWPGQIPEWWTPGTPRRFAAVMMDERADQGDGRPALMWVLLSLDGARECDAYCLRLDGHVYGAVAAPGLPEPQRERVRGGE